MQTRNLALELADRWSRASTMRTKDVDAARDHLQRMLAHHKLTPSRTAKRLDFIHHHLAPGQLSLHNFTYGAEVEVNLSIPDFYLLQITLEGVCEISSRYWDVTLKPGSLFVMNPDIPYTKRWSGRARQLQLKMPANLLRQHLQVELDDAVSRQLDFSAVILSGQDAGAPLLNLVEYLCRDMLDPNGLWRSKYILKQMERAALSAILNTLPHNQVLRLHRRMSPAAPCYVRRAEDYIRAHLCEPISIVEVSTAAGVSSRTLQEGFRRFRDTTPAVYVRDLRLELARRRLLAGSEADLTVTQIALSCGFRHVGRFAKMFVNRYGESPSAMLRRTDKSEIFGTELLAFDD